jgi:hypothetical protein
MLQQQTLAKRAALQHLETVPIFPQERKLMEVATDHHWPFKVMGVAPVPERPVYHNVGENNWWLVPLTEDRSQIPAPALDRVRAIYEAGIRPKAFVIAHEAPKQLMAPAGAPQVSRMEFWANQIARYSLTTAKVTGIILATVVIPLVVAGLGVGLLTLVSLASGIDPKLIVVTDQNVWVEIYSWVEGTDNGRPTYRADPLGG